MTIRHTAVAFTALLIGLLALFASRAYAQVITTLDPGESGDQVSELQSFLAADTSIYPEGLITGYYGSLTTAAVERFQCTYDIVCNGDVASTGFGRVGPTTLAKIESLQGTTASVPGIPNTGAPVDTSAPVMTPAIITVSSTSATISWMTNEPTESAVLYSQTWPFYIGHVPSVWNKTMSTTPVVTITGLTPNTTYYYMRQSLDASGNVQYDVMRTFTTTH